jgi:hypothetical protein
MSDHDAWMAGIGVKLPPRKADAANPAGGIDLFPDSVLEKVAYAPPGPPQAPAKAAARPAPPKDALARAGDGRKFWRPAPADASSPPAVDHDWLDEFLRFYRAGPPAGPDPDGTRCSFNGADLTIAAALAIVDAQATLAGFKTSVSAGGVLQDLIQEGKKAAALGDDAGKAASPDVDKLSALPMTTLLAVLDRMKAKGTFDKFINGLTNVNVRLGAAITTVNGQFEDIAWQSALPKLDAADRAAVMRRAPAKVRPIKPGPAREGEKPEEPVEVEAIIAASKEGVEVQVKLTAHSPYGGNIGETEFTVHIGPEGKISQLELDITAFQQTLSKKGAVAEITVTVSGNATVDLDRSGSRVAPDGLNAQLKTELAAKLKGVKGLSGVTVKLTATYGTSGGAVTAGIEFPIPGT